MRFVCSELQILGLFYFFSLTKINDCNFGVIFSSPEICDSPDFLWVACFIQLLLDGLVYEMFMAYQQSLNCLTLWKLAINAV